MQEQDLKNHLIKRERKPMCRASIIIPAYNAGEYIDETLNSITSQTFADFECVIIDDGSKDNTLEEVRKCSDERIKVISQKNSGGPACPRNVGLAAAKGEYVFIFDSDDVMEPGRLKAYMDIFDSNKKIEFIFSDFSVIDEGGAVIKPNFLSDYSSFKRLLTRVGENLFKLDMKGFPTEIVKANFIGTSGVGFKKSLVKSEKLFDESLSNGDDKLAWVKLSLHADFYFYDKILHRYRVRSESISNKNAEKLYKNKILALKKIEKIYINGEAGGEITKKLAEYNHSLGYFYFKNKNYSMSRFYYFKGFSQNNFYQSIKAILKTYAAQVLSPWAVNK